MNFFLIFFLSLFLAQAQKNVLVVNYDYVFHPKYDKGFVAKEEASLVVDDDSFEYSKGFPKILNSSIPQLPQSYNKSILMG